MHSTPPPAAGTESLKTDYLMKIEPNDITAWLKATVPYFPSILAASALPILACRIPEMAISLGGLATIYRWLMK